MSAATLLDRLEGVRATGSSKWIARCPAHEDRSPSLAIREGDGGTTLIHCFAGCPTAEVLDAIGLSLTDLFPARVSHHVQRQRRAFDAAQVLRCVADEVQIAACVAADVINHKPISTEDYARAQLAADRLWSAVEVTANGH
jgi:hypothetical protein